MAKVKFTSESLPQSSEDLKQALRQALEHATPLDDFVEVVRELAQYELRHGMNSGSFFARFQAGELGDEVDLIRWANKYEVYQETKTELDKHVGDAVDAARPPDLSDVLREIDGILYSS